MKRRGRGKIGLLSWASYLLSLYSEATSRLRSADEQLSAVPTIIGLLVGLSLAYIMYLIVVIGGLYG